MRNAGPSILLLILLILNSCISQNSKTDNPKTIIYYEKCDSIDESPDKYDLNCDCIKINHLTFPMESVVSGKIFKNKSKDYGPFKKGDEFQIDSEFISCFRLLVADTANFAWGELGTTYTDYIIEFYDFKGQLINQANISYDGMLWTMPILRTTKWGLLTSKGLREIKTLMKKFTKQ
ncbi:MAG: hypothetical protein JJU02_00310 [Cryomorphaceae bacterium]|nr:hypothetical protein [Cryomorphaceae bacterium]